jgi:hypothetical protein
MTIRGLPVIALLLSACLAGCVRTSDGSLEPRYVPEMKKVGPVPVVAFKSNRQEPETVFPLRPTTAPAPRLVSVQDQGRPAPRRTVAAPAPRSETVSCQQVAGQQGRVRMDCR